MTEHLHTAAYNEEARLNALRDLNLLDTSPSESFDRLTRLASRLLDAPVSTISLTDNDRQWFKSRVGVDLTEIPREQAPCSYAISSDEVFVVPDLLDDPRFATSPLAQAGIRFYAGAPLFTRQGHGLGTLCVVDVQPRDLNADQNQVLLDLAGMVMAQVELQNMIGRVDATSGLPNQHQMFEELEELARRDGGAVCTGIMFELLSTRQFGQGQRVLGSDFTEALVQGTVDRLRPRLGNSARLYHVGLTRCVVLLTPQFGGDPKAFVRELAALMHEPVVCNGIPVAPAPLLGTCEFPLGELTPRDVLRRLFNALDDAGLAEGGLAQYSPAHDMKNMRSFMLLNDFKLALESTDQLSLVYQPRIDMRTGACVGAEALLRWMHPTLGPISPAEFIPSVEETALVHPLTAWVAKTALRQIEAWAAAGINLKVSINVSALNLDEANFASRLLDAIDEQGVKSASLELEFTESAISRDSTRVAEQLGILRNAGVDVAIDDFGTGYSNLQYLQQLPASVLKIDRSFVTGLEAVERDRTLVRTIIAMAHDLGYRVVAEGIETSAVFDMLKDWDCDEGQGYFMAKPMSAADLARWAGKSTLAA